jgi:hypothetical protein
MLVKRLETGQEEEEKVVFIQLYDVSGPGGRTWCKLNFSHNGSEPKL